MTPSVSSLLRGSVSLIALGAVMAPLAARAQTGPAAPGATAAAAPSNEIVVTGSRVISNGNAMPTPVTVVNTDQLTALQPGPVAEVLDELPAFSGSRNAYGNPGTGVTNAAANELNLRYMGYARSLVLFDGHRLPPDTYDQIVDVDMIPQMLLQRVDVVTGGVSAVYGSDAVAGVVNFVTDTKFNGIKLDLEGGVSTYGDDKTVTGGIALGHSFLDDKLHVELSYEYHNDPGIPFRTDRAWGQEVWTEQGGGTAAAPYHLIVNSRFATSAFGGLVYGATGAGTALNCKTFATNGVLSPFVNGGSIAGLAAPTTGCGGTTDQSGGSGDYYDGTLKYALLTNKFFGRVDYDFTDKIHGYVEAIDGVNYNLNYGNYNQLNGDTFSGTNAFLPAADQFAGTFKLGELMSDAPRVDTNTQEDQYFIVGGLDGKFGDGYDWNLSYSHSQSQSRTRDDNNINNQRLSAALDAVVNPANGQVVCRASLTNSAYSNCVPLNVFGPTAVNAAALAYITQATQYTVANGMDDVSGSLSGAPIKDWAGPITMALSGEWRRQSFGVVSTATPTQLANCAGLTYNCTATTALYADATEANRSTVSESVGEGAFEVDLPLLKDVPFIQNFSFNGAVRYTDYSVSGSAWTWKAGLVWQVNDEWKLRATRSRDIRAPNLYDLYQPTSVSYVMSTDTLTGQIQSTPNYSGGNPNLQPEVGNTTTAGFVYTPKFLPRFSFSVDAYYIDVSNALTSQNGDLPTEQTLCYASGGSSAFCQLQTRALGNYTNTSPANSVTAWYTQEVNISDAKTYGADFEGNYATALFDNPLSMRVLLSWQPHLTLQTPGAPIEEGAGQAFASTGAGGAFAVPQLRLMAIADYKVQSWDFALMERWRSTLYLNQTPGLIYVNQTVPSTYYTDITVTYRLNTPGIGASDLFVNVQNLFNQMPPPAAGGAQSGNLGTYGGFASSDDPVGRYITLGIRFRH